MSVSHVLLRLLVDGPGHGYDLSRQLTAFRHFYPLNNVNVYPLLRDLELQGLLTSRRELADSRMRRVYEITDAGRAELRAWIDAAPDALMPSERDLVALKLALTPRGEAPALAWLERAVTELDAEIDAGHGFLEGQRAERLSELTQLTAEYRLRAFELRRRFLVEAIRLSAGGEATDAPLRGKRVLVADDSLAARVTTTQLLSAAGYEVRLAEHGAEAWALLLESHYDALVSDVLMPELDGFELLRRVRTSEAFVSLPVILNTVLDEPDQRDAALAAGASAFVCKGDADAGRSLVDNVDRLTA